MPAAKPITDNYRAETPYLNLIVSDDDRAHAPFHRDRSGSVRDPSGHVRRVTTRIEDVSPDETARRVAAMNSGQSPKGQEP